MSDITALMATMKAAAISAKELGAIARYSKGRAAIEAFIGLATPDNFLALVEALEKAQKSNQFLKDQLSELANFNPDLDKLEASYESWREIAAELLVAKNRIAELESSTVTLEPFRSFVTNDDIAALHRFAECCDDPESGGHDLEREQVRRLEAIGALQRSGRVSYITGFGDVLISITAGIQVIEGEQKNG